ncbi:MAG: glycosyltransferase family 9 protein, partial [candidate division KSB1 bacterium]|nr:glycosyltransferase family 9 protein [candidate division KSB1 bacterium]
MVSPQKILVIRLSSIGDILLATPLLRILKKTFPQARVDFVIKKKFEELISLNPYIDTLYAFDETRGLAELRQIKKKIRTQNYDLIIDIHKNFRSLYLRTRSGA